MHSPLRNRSARARSGRRLVQPGFSPTDRARSEDEREQHERDPKHHDPDGDAPGLLFAVQPLLTKSQQSHHCEQRGGADFQRTVATDFEGKYPRSHEPDRDDERRHHEGEPTDHQRNPSTPGGSANLGVFPNEDRAQPRGHGRRPDDPDHDQRRTNCIAHVRTFRRVVDRPHAS